MVVVAFSEDERLKEKVRELQFDLQRSEVQFAIGDLVFVGVEFEEAVHARMVDQEKQIVVDTVFPGQVFGWASIIGDGRRTVTARCMEASRIFAIAAADLNALFDADPSMGYRLIKRMANIISKRLKNRTDKLIEAWVEAFDVGEI